MFPLLYPSLIRNCRVTSHFLIGQYDNALCIVLVLISSSFPTDSKPLTHVGTHTCRVQEVENPEVDWIPIQPKPM